MSVNFVKDMASLDGAVTRKEQVFIFLNNSHTGNLPAVRLKQILQGTSQYLLNLKLIRVLKSNNSVLSLSLVSFKNMKLRKRSDSDRTERCLLAS